MKYLRRELAQYKKEAVLAPLFKMLEASFDLLVPLVVAKLIDSGALQKDTGLVIRCCLLLVAMAVLGLLSSFTAQYFAAKAAIGSASQLRSKLFAHIQDFGYPDMDRLGVSTLITRLTGDIQQVQNGLNMFLRLFLRSPFVVAGAVIMAFAVSPRVALLFVAGVAALALIVVAVMRITAPRYKRIQEQTDTVTVETRESLSGVRVIRAFGMEETTRRHFDEGNAVLHGLQIAAGRISALMNPLTYAVVNICLILILRKSAALVNTGELTQGSVIALVNYLSQILVELVKLANLVVLLSRALASLGRVEQVLDTEPVLADNRKGFREPEGEEAVRFDHVHYSYAGAGDESLTDIHFAVRRGETLGIIGGTGSGKSTVVNLIPRFYEATGGCVSVLGHPAAGWNTECLRNRIALVPQKAQLFRGTVRSNLMWGSTGEASDEVLWQALRLAQAEEFVRQKPGGLDEPVEQGGRNFSGGQRQRLTIARALVRKADILILDDSASALDYATDAALRKALRSLPERMTVVIVSQRTSSLKHADHILVLEDGRQAGFGSHESLMADCPVYREIHESQFRKGDEVYEEQ